MARKSTGGKKPRYRVTIPVTAADFTALLSKLSSSKGHASECSQVSGKVNFLCDGVAHTISKCSKNPASCISCPDDAALALLAAILNRDIRASDAAADIVTPLGKLLHLAFDCNSAAIATVASSNKGRAFLQQLITFVTEDIPVLLLEVDKELQELQELAAAAGEEEENDGMTLSWHVSRTIKLSERAI